MAEFEHQERGISKRGNRFYVSVQQGAKRVRKLARLSYPYGPAAKNLIQARAALHILGGSAHQGIDLSASKDRLTISDCLDRLLVHWRTANDGGPITTYDKAERQVEKLRKIFRPLKAREWTYRHAADYMAAAKTQPERGSRSAHLAILRNALNVALRDGLLDRVPKFPPRVDNVRQGYLTAADFESLLPAFDQDDQSVLRFAYLNGQRIQRILALHFTDVDTENWTIKGEPDRGNKGRPAVPLVGAARLVVEERLRAAVGPGWLLFHKKGRRITRDAIWARWHTVMVEKKLPWMIHDFRRSCARNLVNAGVDSLVAMKVTGHKSLTTFVRYAINPDQAVRDALLKRDNHVAEKLRQSVLPSPIPDASARQE